MARGSVRRRAKDTFSIVVEHGYVADPETGKRKRKQTWTTFKGTKKQAEVKLTELMNDLNKQQFVEPTKLSFGEWLDEWLRTEIQPGKRPRTYETYKAVIEQHIKPALGSVLLQNLKAKMIKDYYVSKGPGLSQSTLQQHHTIISGCLEAALGYDMVHRNEAKKVRGKPQSEKDNEDVVKHCWDQDETKKFLSSAREFGPQAAAFYTLALETGWRKAEICGLKWDNLDLDAGTITLLKQLTAMGDTPEWGPLKSGNPRTIDLSPGTVALLRKHKSHQAEIKMANRQAYRDHGLMFAKEWEQMQRRHDTLGHPLQMNNIGQREYAKIIEAAGVRRIKFHGLRHTCASLLLQAGAPPTSVAERLGHKVHTLLTTYAHALPSMQQDAAQKMASILHD
ncbi:MAG: site-specific integrase [Firmicutes bacterium]|nr:site-specific integrase [Bacillota bacterium]MBV1726898.1 site-specific integrase [Desulforudis sp.]MBU4533322.1 site-specific integrase [Bacillota bacterium]MBU4554274.1 site-specific integrase [Bacillota bacterium]MBV1736328.1 site-specific integrase [Desulforudis sp.]